MPVNFGGQNGVFQVPLGKCLVVDYAEAFMPHGQKALFGIITTARGFQVRHYLGMNAAGAYGGQDYFWVSGPAHIYADLGTNVTLRADRDIATGTATFDSAFPAIWYETVKLTKMCLRRPHR